MPSRRTYLLGAAAIVLAVACVALFVPRTRISTQQLPARYSDAEFWQLVSDFSEPGGFFRSDNFVSNETSFQHVIPDLRRRTKPGGVYIGVGPDQNFTYAVALKPRVAFIIDIRRQNMLQHLLYKAIIELSPDRAHFLSRLFSRPLPEDLDANAAPDTLFAAFQKALPNNDLFRRNYTEALQQLTGVHHFTLEAADPGIIEYIYRAFYSAGPDIRYSFPSQYGWRRFPTYVDLMLETDTRGHNHSYMATEENFQTLKQMELENRIVPLVGDFAGEKALRRLGEYLKDNGTTVSAFYTSNVEYYLFQNEDWRKFFRNVASLPLEGDSTFIRAYFNNQRFQPQANGVRPVTLLDNMQELLSAVDHGQIRGYEEVIRRSP